MLKKILAVLLTLISVSIVPIYGSSGNIHINTKVAPSPPVTIKPGGALNLYFGDVTWSGELVDLYLSADGYASLTIPGDVRYGPTFSTSKIVSSSVDTTTYPGYAVGYNWINWTMPEYLPIAGGDYYVKAFDGAPAAVAVTDNYITIVSWMLAVFEDWTPGASVALSFFREKVEEKAFFATQSLSRPIHSWYLADVRVLVLTGLTATEPYSSSEISAIKNWVQNGGSLFFVGDIDGWRTLNPLSQPFGIEFTPHEIQDSTNNYQDKPEYPVIHVFASHQITQNIREIAFFRGSSLNVIDPATAIALTDEDSSPPNAPVLAAALYGKGRVAAIGDGNAINDDGITLPFDNWKLLTNIVDWLVPIRIGALETFEYFLSVSSLHGAPRGQGWYEARTMATLAVEPVVDQGNGTRCVFVGWTGHMESTEPNMTILMGAPKIVTALWKTQYHVQAESDVGSPSGEGWYDEEFTATVSVEDIVEITEGTRAIFAGWTGDVTGSESSISFIVDSPKELKANWNIQHYLQIGVDPPDMATVSGEGWYEEGSNATTGSAQTVIEDEGTKYIFVAWVVDGSEIDENPVSIVMDSPHSAVASYETQHYLKVESEVGNPQGEGWYDEGATATVSVTSPLGLLVQQVFAGWRGDITSTQLTTTITMDSPKTVRATWQADYTQLIIFLGAIVAVGVIGLILMKRR